MSTTVTPIASHADSTITVNGAAVTSGMASSDIALADGETIITVVISAQDGPASRTYTVTLSSVTGPVPSCQDGLDNDGDGSIDYPQDPGCDSADDTDETDAADVSVFAPSHPDHDRLLFDANFESENPAFSDADEGTFRITCAFSHFNYHDPIVFPNAPDAAHLHMYLGNIDVDHNSTTPEELRQSNDSTCDGGPLNKTAYWVPSVIAPLFQKTDSVTGPNRGFAIDANERPVPVTDMNDRPQYQAVTITGDYRIDINGNYHPEDLENSRPN
jgi:hypothetical protein